jgi:YVTN family beta-propeller protein
VDLAIKPDGGEMIVSNFGSNSIAIIETGTNEVGGTNLIGSQPARALVTSDNSRAFVSNFGSNTVAVYDIDIGKVIASLPVGSRPDGLALSQSQAYLLVLNSQSGDVTVIQRRRPTKLEPTEYSLVTMIPVGVQPNNIVVKAFMLKPAGK